MRLLSRGLWLGVLALVGLGPVAAGAQTKNHPRLMAQVASGEVLACAFSLNGRNILTGSKDGTARLWDIETGQELQSFAGEGWITTLALSSDNRRVLTVGKTDEETIVQLWDETTGKELQRFSIHSDKVIMGAISPDGRILTSVSSAETDEHGRELHTVNIQTWNVDTGKELHRFVLESPDVLIDSAVLSPDGSKLFTGNFDGPRLWDLQTGKELQRFERHSEVVSTVVFSPDGRRVLTGSIGGTVRLLDTETGKEIQHIRGMASGQFVGVVNSVAISPDGRRVLTGSNDHKAHLLDVETGKELQHYSGHSSPVNCVAFSPDGHRVLTGSGDQTARLWSADTGEEVRRFAGLADEIASLAFVAQGSGILTTSSTGRSWLWDGETGKATLRSGWSSPGSVTSVAISKDGRRVFLFSYLGGEQSVWDIETGKEIQRLDTHTYGNGSSADSSSDGRKLLATNGGAAAWLLDVETGKELQSFVVKTGLRLPSTEGYTRDAIASLALSPDGKRALTGDREGTVRLWNVATGKQLRSFHMPTIRPLSVSFSPDGRGMLAGSSDQPSQLRDVETGKVLQRFAGYSQPSFSADGRRVLLGLSVWDVETGKQLQRFLAPSGHVTYGTLSGDGHRVLMSFNDGTTSLWDVESGKELATLYCFQNGNWAVVDPDSRFDTNDPHGDVPLHWIVDDDSMRALPLETFMPGYYTPGLLVSIMKGQTLPPIGVVARSVNRLQPGAEP